MLSLGHYLGKGEVSLSSCGEKSMGTKDRHEQVSVPSVPMCFYLYSLYQSLDHFMFSVDLSHFQPSKVI